MSFYAFYPPTNIISGTVTANQGLPNTDANAWPVKIVKNFEGNLKNYYNAVSSVPNSVLTDLQTYIVTSTSAVLYEVDVSGTNIAAYTVVLNGNILMKRLTNFGCDLNETFNFNPGLTLANGDVLKVKVLQNRPTVGDYNSTILVSEI